MYVRSVSGRHFRSFAKFEVELELPDPDVPLSNITLLMGENGAGKTSLMRAITLACCAEPLRLGGFHSVFNVRRTPENSPTEAILHGEILPGEAEQTTAESLAIDVRLERIADSEELTANSLSIAWRAYRNAIHQSESPGWFFVAYHASRRSEPGSSYSPSSRKRGRSERFERVASLFEDHVDLVPLDAWLPGSSRYNEVRAILDDLLPGRVRLSREPGLDEVTFEVDNVPMPYGALSDGYRAFLAWAGDLLFRLQGSTPSEVPMRIVSGVVLVDEVDLHLHPAWQRMVLHRLSAAFPRLQFIATTHSPLVLGSVRHHQVRLLKARRGRSRVERPTEPTWGRSPDQLLASDFFGLDRIRDDLFLEKLANAESKLAGGGLEAAMAYADMLARGGEEAS